jgi:hypothetical protein
MIKKSHGTCSYDYVREKQHSGIAHEMEFTVRHDEISDNKARVLWAYPTETELISVLSINSRRSAWEASMSRNRSAPHDSSPHAAQRDSPKMAGNADRLDHPDRSPEME